MLDDGLAAIALPLWQQERPIGALTILWPRTYKKHTEFVKEYLVALEEATEAVNRDLQRYADASETTISG